MAAWGRGCWLFLRAPKAKQRGEVGLCLCWGRVVVLVDSLLLCLRRLLCLYCALWTLWFCFVVGWGPFFVRVLCLFLAMCFEGIDFGSCLVVVKLMVFLYVSSCFVLLALCVDVSRFVANCVSPLFPWAILFCREDHNVEYVLCEVCVPGGVLVKWWFSIRYCYVVVFFVIFVFVCPLGVRVWSG